MSDNDPWTVEYLGGPLDGRIEAWPTLAPRFEFPTFDGRTIGMLVYETQTIDMPNHTAKARFLYPRQQRRAAPPRTD